jgi:hypothetical protein
LIADGNRKRQRKLRRHRMRPTLLALEECSLLSTIIVNNPTDTPATGQIDLRQAITQANTATSPSSIEFELGSTAAMISLRQGQLELSNTSYPTTIYDGPGQGPVTVSGNNASRVFQIDSGVTASISGLTMCPTLWPTRGRARSTSARPSGPCRIRPSWTRGRAPAVRPMSSTCSMRCR